MCVCVCVRRFCFLVQPAAEQWGGVWVPPPNFGVQQETTECKRQVLCLFVQLCVQMLNANCFCGGQDSPAGFCCTQLSGVLSMLITGVEQVTTAEQQHVVCRRYNEGSTRAFQL